MGADIVFIPHGLPLGGCVRLFPCEDAALEMRGDVLRLNPRLPENLDSLQLSIQYRDREFGLIVTQKDMKIVAAADWTAPLSIEVCGQCVELTASGSVTLDLEQLRHTPPHHDQPRRGDGM